MSVLESIILGIFQGIAEFLPISSSGHLVLLQKFFGIEEGNLFFTTMLHFGTLISIIIVYFKDLVKIITEVFKLLVILITTGKFKLDNDYKKIGILVFIGSIPTALIGIFFGDLFKDLYNSIIAIAIAFIITGFLLMISEKKASGNRKAKDLTVSDAIFIGICQGLAIAPGISRSGSTIVGGLFRGLNKKLATKFSFFLALPAILGASILELKGTLGSNQLDFEWSTLFIGILASAITGFLAIKMLIRLIERGKLYYFSYYLWVLASIIILYEII